MFNVFCQVAHGTGEILSARRDIWMTQNDLAEIILCKELKVDLSVIDDRRRTTFHQRQRQLTRILAGPIELRMNSLPDSSLIHPYLAGHHEIHGVAWSPSLIIDILPDRYR